MVRGAEFNLSGVGDNRGLFLRDKDYAVNPLLLETVEQGFVTATARKGTPVLFVQAEARMSVRSFASPTRAVVPSGTGASGTRSPSACVSCRAATSFLEGTTKSSRSFGPSRSVPNRWCWNREQRRGTLASWDGPGVRSSSRWWSSSAWFALWIARADRHPGISEPPEAGPTAAHAPTALRSVEPSCEASVNPAPRPTHAESKRRSARARVHPARIQWVTSFGEPSREAPERR
jgi:hypothetical protein